MPDRKSLYSNLAAELQKAQDVVSNYFATRKRRGGATRTFPEPDTTPEDYFGRFANTWQQRRQELVRQERAMSPLGGVYRPATTPLGTVSTTGILKPTRQEQEKQYELERRKELAVQPEDAARLRGTIEVFGRGLSKLPRLVAASVLQGMQGQGGASVTDRDWADRYITDAQTDLTKFVSEVGEKYGESNLLISPTDLARLPENLAYSLTSMGAGIAAGAPVALIPLPGARVAAWAIGTAASGAMAYSMTTYQIMQQYLELKNDEKIAQVGRGLTVDEEVALKSDFEAKAREYGLWEAVPEAISNLAFAKILTTPLTKIVGKGIAVTILSKLAGMYGEELLTETITQKGQSAIEVEVGLRDGRITWQEAFREVAPQTFLLTTVMGGVGSAVISSTKAIGKAKASLVKEIGASHPLYKTIESHIPESLRRTIAEPERGGIGGEVPPDMQKAVGQAKAPIPSKYAKLEAQLKDPQYLRTRIQELEKRAVSPKISLQHRIDARNELTQMQSRLAEIESAIPKAPEQAVYPEPVERVMPQQVEGMPEAGVSVQTGLAGLGKEQAQAQMLGEFAGTGQRQTLIDIEKERARLAAKPLEGQIELPTTEVAYEANAEIEGLQETLKNDPIAQATFKIGNRNVGIEFFISIREQNFPEYFTVKMAQSVFPGHKFSQFTQKGTPQYDHVPKDAALDDLTKRFKMSPDEIANHVMEIRRMKDRIKELQRPIAGEEVPEEVAPGLATEPGEAEISAEIPVTTLPTQTGQPPVKPPGVPPTTEMTIPEEPGKPTLTQEQTDLLLKRMGEIVESPQTANLYDLTIELRKIELSKRIAGYERLAQSYVMQGKTPKEAMDLAKSAMSGTLPTAYTDVFSDLTEAMTDVLFAKVYYAVKGFEQVSTVDALTNFLATGSLPNIPGTKGGSAYTRLQAVFGNTPIMKMIEKAAKEKKPLKDVVEGIFRPVVEGGSPPIPVDQEMADYLRNLEDVGVKGRLIPNLPYVQPPRPLISEMGMERYPLPATKIPPSPWDLKTEAQRTTDMERLRIEFAHKPEGVTQFEPPIEKAFKEVPFNIPGLAKYTIVDALKETGLGAVDIGSLIKGQLTSLDTSWWRPEMWLIAANMPEFLRANMLSLAMVAQPLKQIEIADAHWAKIQQDPLLGGRSFLRPWKVSKGEQGVEEYGYVRGGKRPIQRLAAWLPWIKHSEAIYDTCTNDMNSAIFLKHYKNQLKISERIASGKVKMPVGQVFSVKQNMDDMEHALAHLARRVRLGKFQPTGEVLTPFTFSIQHKVTPFLVGRDLLFGSKWSRLMAWENVLATIGSYASVIVMGAMLGWWGCSFDSNSSDFMKPRIGRTRFDVWGGIQQLVVLATRLGMTVGISPKTGKEYKVRDWDALGTYLRSSSSPLVGILLDIRTGKTYSGKKTNLLDWNYWARETLIPMAIQDIYDAFQDNLVAGLISVPAATMGIGVQTYESTTSTPIPYTPSRKAKSLQ